MTYRGYVTQLKLDDAEIQRRRAFFELADDDLGRLAALRPFAEKHTDAVVEDFYKLLLGTRRDAQVLRRRHHVTSRQAAQREYFLGLFTGQCDLAYVEDRLRVGAAHERIGMAPNGTWARTAVTSSPLRANLRGPSDPKPAKPRTRASSDSSPSTCRWRSTPTSRLTSRPSGGTRPPSESSRRPSSSVTTASCFCRSSAPSTAFAPSRSWRRVLVASIEEQAKVIILDIAGVPVVDTKVADNLVKTTASVRLLGAQTILTGISAQVARTIVQLGVDLSMMHTLSSLAEGIELALSLLGKTITTKAGMSVRGTIPILRIGAVLLATVHIDFATPSPKLSRRTSSRRWSGRRPPGIVIDISGLDTVDTTSRESSPTSGGPRAHGNLGVIVGLRPEVAATLVRMGYAMDGLRTALDLDEGLEAPRLASSRRVLTVAVSVL